MATPDGMALAAGGIAFAGNFAESDGFPANGYAIIGGTIALSFIAALASTTPLKPAVRAFTGLVLLVAIFRYVPALNDKRKRKVLR